MWLPGSRPARRDTHTHTHTHTHKQTCTHTHTHPGLDPVWLHGSWLAGQGTQTQTYIHSHTHIPRARTSVAARILACWARNSLTRTHIHTHIHTHTHTFTLLGPESVWLHGSWPAGRDPRAHACIHTHTRTYTHLELESVWLPGFWPAGRGAHTHTHNSGEYSPFPQERVSEPGRCQPGGGKGVVCFTRPTRARALAGVHRHVSGTVSH